MRLVPILHTHPTTPGPSRPTPWTDTTFPPLICRRQNLGPSGPPLLPSVRGPAESPFCPSRRVTNATVAGDGGHENQNMSGPVAFAEGCCLTGHDHAVKPDTCPTAAAVQEEVIGEGIDGDSEHRSRVEVVYRCFGAFWPSCPVPGPNLVAAGRPLPPGSCLASGLSSRNQNCGGGAKRRKRLS